MLFACPFKAFSSAPFGCKKCNYAVLFSSLKAFQQSKKQLKLHIILICCRRADANNRIWQTELLKQAGEKISILIIQTSATKPDVSYCFSGYSSISTDLTEENFHMVH